MNHVRIYRGDIAERSFKWPEPANPEGIPGEDRSSVSSDSVPLKDFDFMRCILTYDINLQGDFFFPTKSLLLL